MGFTKREEIYDREISPLMATIIEVCKRHDIPMVFSCQLNDDREHLTDVNDEDEEIGPFFCCTLLAANDHTHKKLLRAVQILKPEPPSQWRAEVIYPDGRRECVGGSHMDGE